MTDSAKRCPFCGKEAEVLSQSDITGYWPQNAQARCPDVDCVNEWMELDKWNKRDINCARDEVYNRGFHDVEEFYQMPPKKEYSITLDVESVEKGKPKI